VVQTLYGIVKKGSDLQVDLIVLEVKYYIHLQYIHDCINILLFPNLYFYPFHIWFVYQNQFRGHPRALLSQSFESPISTGMHDRQPLEIGISRKSYSTII